MFFEQVLSDIVIMKFGLRHVGKAISFCDSAFNDGF